MATMTVMEIAKLAGVSMATVSRVMNDSPRVAPAVAKTVRDAMQRAGYEARTRRTPKRDSRTHLRTGNILLLVCGHPIDRIAGYPALLRGIENALRDNRLKLVLASFENPSTLPIALDANQVDGVLLFGRPESITPAVWDKMKRMAAIGMLRGFDECHQRIDCVIYDNASVGPLAARYLIERGHQRLAFFNSDPSHPAMIARLHDFKMAAAETGAQVVPFVSSIRPEDVRQETAVYQSLTDRLLAESPRIPAIFVAADYQAPWLYASLEARGVSPAEFDIICCDKTPLFLDRLVPRPASIDINLELVGYNAVQQLLWRLSHPKVINRIKTFIEPVLVPGEERISA
jgi:DNA-binding LacI/PurR family transcriptional regulator